NSSSGSSGASGTPKPAGFDWTLPAIGLVLFLGGAAFFLTRRKPQGL
ncbi:LPXTG cell wall anchor domain-containing protein, partial [Candidatus Micrarchaeota archaeon]|nr:LPXTG cell wall anchor domain-containing protein [Candidatus Micrarchaeota archaeon]